MMMHYSEDPMNSLLSTQAIFVSCRTTSKWLKIGLVKRSCSDVGMIEDGKRSNLD